MKTVVIYHRADFDGLFCREIARKFLGDRARYIGWDYGDPLPAPDQVSAEDTVYMLDISIDGLMDHPKLIWIDHHKSAMEKFGIKPGLQIDGVAACRLAWQFFSLAALRLPALDKQTFVDRLVTEPYAVQLAGEYDIWDKRNPDAEVFQFGLRSRELNDYEWSRLLSTGKKASVREIEGLIEVGHPPHLNADGTLDESYELVGILLQDGVKLKRYQAERDEVVAKRGFTASFEGLTFLAINVAYCNSATFVAALKPEHDALLGFYYDGKLWRVSLYHAPGKEQHDLSLIAVKYGGGGHRGACGFRTEYLPFVSNNERVTMPA